MAERAWGAGLETLGKGLIDFGSSLDARAAAKRKQELEDEKWKLEQAKLSGELGDAEKALTEREATLAAIAKMGALGKGAEEQAADDEALAREQEITESIPQAPIPEQPYRGGVEEAPYQSLLSSRMPESRAAGAKLGESSLAARKFGAMGAQDRLKFAEVPRNEISKPYYEAADKEATREDVQDFQRQKQEDDLQNRIKLEEMREASREKIAGWANALGKDKLLAKDDKSVADKLEKYTSASTERASLKGLIDEIIMSPYLASGLDPTAILNAVPGTKQFYIAQKLKQLTDKIALSNRQMLKGSGAISDKETEMLNRAGSIASSRLARNDLLAELRMLRSGVDILESNDKAAFMAAEQRTAPSPAPSGAPKPKKVWNPATNSFEVK